MRRCRTSDAGSRGVVACARDADGAVRCYTSPTTGYRTARTSGNWGTHAVSSQQTALAHSGGDLVHLSTTHGVLRGKVGGALV